VAGDAVDDTLCISRSVSVTDGGINLGLQHPGVRSEKAAEHYEAEGAKMVDLGGTEHSYSSSMGSTVADRWGESPTSRRSSGACY